MRHVTINVLLKCLSYDFAGTSLDEAGEDIGTVQVNHLFHDMDMTMGLTRVFMADPFFLAIPL